MTFFYPKLLWLLAIPAFLLAWDIWRLRKNGRTANGAAGNKILTATAGASSVQLVTKPAAPGRRLRAIRWYLAVGLACACAALARPQWGRIEEPVFDQSREILIAVDLSRSMLAEDVKPNRLDRSRLLIESLLGELKGERVGLIVFAGTAFLQAPLSSDYEILREFLPIIGPDYLPQAGTNYEAMLRTAVDSFGQGSADRFLVVLSDGEADPASPWRDLAGECKKRGIKAVTLGVGTQTGAMLSGADGNLLKDERGAVVLSRLEPATLQELADITGGTYTDASHWVDLAELIKATVAKGAKGNFREESRIRLAERFQWALGPAVLFLLLSLWREFPVQPRPRRMALAVVRAASPLLFALWLVSGTSFADAPAASDPASALSLPPGKEQAPTVDTSQTAKKLSELVGRLSASGAISSQEAVALAEATLAYGQPLRAQGKPVPNGPLDDAIEAVNRAEKKESAAANWSDLRAKLEALRQKPPAESQKQKQDQDKKDQQKDQNQQDQKKQNEQGKSGQDQDKKDQDKKDQQQDKQNSSDQSQKSDNASEQQNKQQKDSQSGASQDKSKQQDQQSGSSADGQQKKDQQQNDSGKKSDDQKTDSNQTDKTPGKENQGKPKEPAAKSNEKAFDSMQEKPGGAKEQSPAKQLPAPEPADAAKNQKVGGVAAEGTPLDKNVDPNLLVPLQRLERAKAGDVPGILFRRMQPDQPEKQPSKGRSW